MKLSWPHTPPTWQHQQGLGLSVPSMGTSLAMALRCLKKALAKTLMGSHLSMPTLSWGLLLFTSLYSREFSRLGLALPIHSTPLWGSAQLGQLNWQIACLGRMVTCQEVLSSWG